MFGGISSSLSFVPGASSGSSDLDSMLKHQGGSGRSAAGAIKSGSQKYDYFDQSKAKSQEEADKAREAAYQQQMAALGLNELGQYQDIATGAIDPTTGQPYNTGITPEQQAAIEKQTAAETAKMRQAMSDRGATVGTMAAEGTGSVQTDKLAAMEAVRNATAEQHWNAFIQATGIATGSSQILQAMNEADRKEAMQIYSSAMGTAGAVAGKYSGYKSTIDEYTTPKTITQGSDEGFQKTA